MPYIYGWSTPSRSCASSKGFQLCAMRITHQSPPQASIYYPAASSLNDLKGGWMLPTVTDTNPTGHGLMSIQQDKLIGDGCVARKFIFMKHCDFNVYYPRMLESHEDLGMWTRYWLFSGVSWQLVSWLRYTPQICRSWLQLEFTSANVWCQTIIPV